MLPGDEECRQSIKILCEYEPPTNAPGLLAEDQQREIRGAIQSGSASIEQFRQLVHHLSNSRKLDEVEQVLDQATMLHGTTLRLQDWREHLAMVRGWAAMEIANDLQTLQHGYSQLPQRKRDESNRIDLQIYGRRCERYPDDLQHQLQLGRLLNANGNYSEAIKRLEHIAGIEEHRAQALAELGRSWEKLKQREKAVACYQEAIDLARSHGDIETERKALRSAARVAERNGDNELARGYYARLLEFPINCDLDRTYQELYQRMLDNLDDVCHNL
jgi:tetratricopeptide (TPR) repeat protein